MPFWRRRIRIFRHYADVIPWVEAHAPASAEQRRRMEADPWQPRFTLVFDRYGYSPDLFEELQQRRIAVLS